MDRIQPKIFEVRDKHGSLLETTLVVKSGNFFEVDLPTRVCPKEKDSITIITDSMEFFCKVDTALHTFDEGFSKLKATINSAIIRS